MQAVRAASLAPLAGETICNPISTPAPIVIGLKFSLAPTTKPVVNPIAKAVTPSVGLRQALEPGQIKSQTQEQIVSGSAKPANKTQNNIVCENESCESRS